MDSLYIGIILFCRVVQHLCNKKTSNEIRELPVFIHYAAVRQILSALLAVLLIIIARNGFHCDFRTVLIAAFSGVQYYRFKKRHDRAQFAFQYGRTARSVLCRDIPF